MLTVLSIVTAMVYNVISAKYRPGHTLKGRYNKRISKPDIKIPILTPYRLPIPKQYSLGSMGLSFPSAFR